MTDGPFKYTDLSPRWKKYGEFLDEDIFNADDRLKQAQKALIEDLAPAVFKAMVRDIHRQLDSLQGHLFPERAIEAIEQIIDRHAACEQSETFRKNIINDVRQGHDVPTAFGLALNSTSEIGIAQAKERLDAHCIEVDEKRSRRDKSSALKMNHTETFARIDPSFLKDEIFGKATISQSVKVSRSEEGPPL